MAVEDPRTRITGAAVPKAFHFLGFLDGHSAGAFGRRLWLNACKRIQGMGTNPPTGMS